MEPPPTEGSSAGRLAPRAGSRGAARGQARSSARARVVLLADDDPVVRHVVRLLIELQGDTVLEAEDGEQAVAAAAAYAGPIDLLLTDVMMPGRSGPEVCQAIREQRPGLPTLFISGYFPEAVFPDRKVPARATFLSKPFMPEELAEAFESLLQESEALDAEAAGRNARDSAAGARPLAFRAPMVRTAGSAEPR